MNSKYRIIRSNDPNYSYDVEKKKWSFWWHVKSTHDLDDAERFIKRIFDSKCKGKIVKEYDSHDFLVDRLKG